MVYSAVGYGALVAFLFLTRDILINHSDNLWRIAILLGPILITIGWMASNEVLLVNQRKHHTINLITDHISGKQRIKDKTLIRYKIGSHPNKMSRAIADFDKEDDKIIQAIDREINFYEFLAAGIVTGDIDKRIVERTLTANLCDFYEQMESYITHHQNKNPTTWEHYTDLYNNWQSRRREKMI